MDPFTIMMVASMGMQAFSSIKGGEAQAEDLEAKRAIDRHNALLAQIDAKALGVQGQEDDLLRLYEGEMAMGGMRNAQGAMGARTDVGAPFQARAQFGSMMEWQRMRESRKWRKGVEDLKQESASYSLQAKSYGSAARNAKTAGYLGAGSAILGGMQTGAKYGGWFSPKASGSGGNFLSSTTTRTPMTSTFAGRSPG